MIYLLQYIINHFKTITNIKMWINSLNEGKLQELSKATNTLGKSLIGLKICEGLN